MSKKYPEAPMWSANEVTDLEEKLELEIKRLRDENEALTHRIADLEDSIDIQHRSYAGVVRDYNKIKAENEALRNQIADWQDRFSNSVYHDEDQNQYVLIWTARELHQAQKEADEICKALGIAIDEAMK